MSALYTRLVVNEYFTPGDNDLIDSIEFRVRAMNVGRFFPSSEITHNDGSLHCLLCYTFAILLYMVHISK